MLRRCVFIRENKLRAILSRSLSEEAKNKYSHTVILPTTTFPQRANSQFREIELQKFWNDNKLYETMRNCSIDGTTKGNFVLHDGPPYGI